MTPEAEITEAILKLCRKRKGLLCMRSHPSWPEESRFRIVDNSRFAPDPIVEGASWLEVLQHLQAEED